MSRMQLIHLYSEGITDFETSPFEMLETFHIRSELQQLELSKEEKKLVAAYDMKLLSNAEEIFEHVSKAYDFSKSEEPIEEWWWHLNLLLSGEIIFNAAPLQNPVT